MTEMAEVKANGAVRPGQVPKFNCNRMGDCIVVSLNIPMAQVLVELLADFNAGDELHPHEFAFFRQLEKLAER